MKRRIIVIASCLAVPTLCAIACTGGTHQGVGGLGTGDDGGSRPDGSGVDAMSDADATSQGDTAGGNDAPRGDELPIDIDAKPPPGSFCALPGSVVFTQQGPEVVPGSDASTPDIGWLSLPVGFCAHYFGTVQMTRQLRFAPDGHLFVTSPAPNAVTTGGSNNGLGEILVLPDDNQDGVADSNIEYLGMLEFVQGLYFGGGFLYYQFDTATIARIPFQNGDLSPSGASQTFTAIPLPQDPVHWTKVIDVAPDGTLYVTNGSSQSESCLSTRPPVGTINKVSPDGGTSVVAKGFRNPISLRCEHNHDVCLVTELALDYSNGPANFGREKLLPVRQGDDWGYPCCATQNRVYMSEQNNQVPVTYADTGGTVDCSGVSAEPVSFVIGETPFGVEVEESGKWPAPYGNRAYVTMHGEFGSWTGARVLSVALDANGMPLPATDLDGSESANMTDFATGWDDGTRAHGRPGTITFAPDGRMFIGNDQTGMILWISPVNLMP